MFTHNSQRLEVIMPATEKPRAEPEIIPPGDLDGRPMRDRYHFDVHGGSQRIYVTRLGPFGIVVLALRAHLNHRHHKPRLRWMAERLQWCQDDDRAARSPDPPLRHHRNWKWELALQKPSRRSRPNPRSRRLRNPDQLRRREHYHPSSSLKRVKIGRRSWVKFGSLLTISRSLLSGATRSVRAPELFVSFPF